MIHVTKEELIKLAQAANLSLSENEIPALLKRLEEVLSYAEYLHELHEVSQELPRLSNVVREDAVKEVQVEPLRALAPEQEQQFYVVPAILKQ